VTRARHATGLAAALAALALATAPAAPARAAAYGASVHASGGPPLGAFGDAAGFALGLESAAWSASGARPWLRLRSALQHVQTLWRDDAVPAGRTAGGTLGTRHVSATWAFLLGPELAASSGALRPYAWATAGPGWFRSRTDLAGDLGGTRWDRTVARSAWGLAWSGGAGARVPVGAPERGLELDLAVEVRGQQGARFLAPADVTGDATGLGYGDARRTAAVAVFRAGFSRRLW